MTWLIWRQHRAEALALTAVVAFIGLMLLVLGLPMHGLFPQGWMRCAAPPLDQACRLGVSRLQTFTFVTPLLTLLNLVPFTLGAFIGAPLLARELETGTWQLAWTQSVPRMRWLGGQVGATLALTGLLAAAFSAAVGWFRQPMDMFGRFGPDGFDVTGPLPVAYALFAFGLAAAAGVLWRRSLPALATALVVFLAARITVAVVLRPHYQAPLEITEPVRAGPIDTWTPLVAVRDWTLDESYIDATGRHLSTVELGGLEHAASVAGVDPGTYVGGLGVRHWASYHPADRFWPFQLTESAIFAGLAVVLLAVVVWRVRRRAF